MSVTGNSMTAQKLLTNEKQNDALKSAIAGIVNVQPKDVVIKSLKDVALTEEALLGEMKQSQDEGFVDISEFAKRVAELEDQHSEVYKENQQLTKLNIELAENKRALEDKINNWKAENEKLRQAIAERQTTLDITNAGSGWVKKSCPTANLPLPMFLQSLLLVPLLYLRLKLNSKSSFERTRMMPRLF